MMKHKFIMFFMMPKSRNLANQLNFTKYFVFCTINIKKKTKIPQRNPKDIK